MYSKDLRGNGACKRRRKAFEQENLCLRDGLRDVVKMAEGPEGRAISVAHEGPTIGLYIVAHW